MSEVAKSGANLMGTPDCQRSRIGRIIDSLTKFGLHSSIDVSPKASTGVNRNTYGIVQERLRNHPSTSLSLKVKTKREDSETGPSMNLEAEQGEKETSSSSLSIPLASVKKAPTGKHTAKDSDVAETGKKRIFIRSRMSVMLWRTRSSRFDTSSSDNGGTRLIKAIRALQTRIGIRFQELMKNLPLKLLFFLVGFYCATAFATVIGQTGDWDILSAALAVAVVEAIGALMYNGSLRLFSNFKSLVTVFNYWKAGLTLGLFLDSFKYEADKFHHIL
ncbi:Ycf20-like protein [Linum grandiflorum]